MLHSNLTRALYEADISIAELARRADIPLDTVKNIYYGKVTDPKASTVLALSKALGVSVNYLMGDLILSKDECDLIFNYRHSSEKGKAATLQFSDVERRLSEENIDGRITDRTFTFNEWLAWSAATHITVITDLSKHNKK